MPGDDGHAISDPGKGSDAGWVQAVVPGTVLTTLVAVVGWNTFPNPRNYVARVRW